MRISLYLGSLDGTVVDARNLDNGNPGIGGTQFCMLELASYLNKNTSFEIYIIANRQYILPSGISFLKCSDDQSLSRIIETINSDILILPQFRNTVLEEELSQMKCKIIIWAHNYIYSDFCKYISRINTIRAVVFVGKQQYDRYIDDDVITKSTYIYNMFTDNSPDIVRESDGCTVVYMGALVEGKGFAELCRLWPRILDKVPEARLLVLGSGALYGDAVLGKYGLAPQSYERKFMKYITDSKGSIIPSVRFLGVVGNAKTEIFRTAAVGVVNPTARTETFCMGVAEMAEARLPVVTLAKNGLFDTVEDGKTGVLAKSLAQVGENIVALLKDPYRNKTLGNEAKKRIQQFSPDKIGPQWVDLLCRVQNDTYQPMYLGYSKPLNNNLKLIRIAIRFIRFSLRFRFIPSMIAIETLGVRFLNRVSKGN